MVYGQESVIMGDKQAKNALSIIIEGCAQLQEDGSGPSRVLVMSGAPLSGKSHLVNLIEKRVPGSFLLVRSDDVRPVVSKCLGRKRPAYDDIEHVTTFIVAGEVIRTGLTLNWPIIVDATNLKEDFRRWAYDAADDLKAEVVVVFMEVTDEVALARLSERSRHGSAATLHVYMKLKYEMGPIRKCTRPYVIINSEGDLRPYAKSLANWLTGKADTIPGLKNRHYGIEKFFMKQNNIRTEPEAATVGTSTKVYASEPFWKDRNKKVYQGPEPEVAVPDGGVYASEPFWKSRTEKAYHGSEPMVAASRELQSEEKLPEETAQLPEPSKAPEPPELKVVHEGEQKNKKTKGAKRIVYDFYTGEPIELD